MILEFINIIYLKVKYLNILKIFNNKISKFLFFLIYSIKL